MRETCKRSSCVGTDCEGCDDYKDDTPKQTIKERVSNIVLSYDDALFLDADKVSINAEKLDDFEAELDKAYHDHFIEL